MKLADLIRLERQKTPTPGPAAIRAALIAQGHAVTVSYIKLVLWRDRRPKKKAKKRRPWQKHWPKENSRSKAIKDLLDKDSTMTTAAIKAELEKKGLQVSANLIKVVRHHWRPKRRSRFSEDFKAKHPDFPTGGTQRKKTQAQKATKTEAEVDAEVDEILNRLTEE